MRSGTRADEYMIIAEIPGSPMDDENLWMGGKFNVARFLDEALDARETTIVGSSRLREFVSRSGLGREAFVAAMRQVSRELQKANVPYLMTTRIWDEGFIRGRMRTYWTPGMSAGVIYFEDEFEKQGIDWESILEAIIEGNAPPIGAIVQKLKQGYIQASQVDRYLELNAILGG